MSILILPLLLLIPRVSRDSLEEAPWEGKSDSIDERNIVKGRRRSKGYGLKIRRKPRVCFEIETQHLTISRGLPKNDIVNENTFAPGNHWGGTHTVWDDPKFYDYVDFINVQRMLDFCKSNNMTTEMNKITEATNQYINYELAM